MPSLLDQIERVPVSSLTLFPGNARKGNQPAIAASLAAHGQVTPLVVQRSTRHVLGGNNTWNGTSTSPGSRRTSPRG